MEQELWTYSRGHCENKIFSGLSEASGRSGVSAGLACHLPEKTTVFGVGKRTQDIYNANALNDILAKAVITRTFEDVTGKEIRRIHQTPVRFSAEEWAVYVQEVKEFECLWRNYFASGQGNGSSALTISAPRQKNRPLVP